MNLKDKIINKNILVPMYANSKQEAIHELLNHLHSQKILSSTVKLFANINEQENEFTSSAGRGIAFPHSVSNEIKELAFVLGISPKGIDFDSPDGHACHLILLTLSTRNEPTKHRKFITRFRSMVQYSDIRTNLYDSNNSYEVLKIISKWEENDNFRDDLI